MNPDNLFVTLEGGGPDRVPYAVLKPPLQVFAKLQIISIKDKPPIPVRHRLRELLRDFRPCLAVDRLLLGTIGRVYGVATHPPAILPLRYASLAVASTLRHYLTPLPSS